MLKLQGYMVACRECAFAKQTGNELLESTEKDKIFEFYLKRK